MASSKILLICYSRQQITWRRIIYDLSILRSFTKKDNYQQYRNFLKKEDFLKELQPVLRGFDDWYATNQEEPTVEDIANFVFAAGIPDAQENFLREVLNTLAAVPVPASAQLALQRFKQNRICEKLALASYNFSSGIGRLDDVLLLTDQLRTPEKETLDDSNFVTDDIEAILKETVLTPGLRWRLASLNRSLGSLRKGDFGFIFKRPESGGTTFIADQTAFMASQLKEDDGPILWFNNEEQGSKVRLRSYEAALGATLDQILRSRARAKEAYLKATKGKIEIFDSAYITRGTVESLIRTKKPRLVVIDQLSKLKGFEDDRKDLELGAICQWGRETSKTSCPVIGVHQAGGEGEGIKWLNMGHVSNAKTAMQAEADFLIGIGKSNETGFEKIRYFNICKNKLTGDPDTDPEKRHAQIEVYLNAEIARYEDM